MRKIDNTKRVEKETERKRYLTDIVLYFHLICSTRVDWKS